MKRVGLVLSVLLVLFFSSCEKYKQNQPAYLSFNWAFSHNSFNETKVVLTGGNYYTGQVSVNGKRTGASDVAIEQNFPVQNVSYQNEGAIGVNLDVPVGDYSDFTVGMKIDESVNPCIALNGLYFNGTDSIAVRIEWKNSDALIFKTQNGFSLKKKNSYSVRLDINTNQLFSSVSSLQWSQASTSLENGVPTIVIRNTFNVGIFNDINEELQNSLTLVVE